MFGRSASRGFGRLARKPHGRQPAGLGVLVLYENVTP